MTTTELTTRIENAEKKVQNKTATILKKQQWIESGNKDHHEVKWLLDDIRRLNKEIVETQKTIEKYNKQLTGEIERERILTKIPESMIELQTQLVDRWNKHDRERKAMLQADYDRLGYKEWVKIHNKADYMLMGTSVSDFEKVNADAARILIIDLWHRINHITGEVTNWSELRFSGGALNGVVTGKEGCAVIESILAGGWNIQRLHIRVLVRSI